MKVEPLPITMIGDPLPYADGVESELLELLSTVGDRRVGSDELAAVVRDWPTAYHLAPERAVLLAPVVIGSGDRVLDIGAGSGVNTRICADRGAMVTAVEGSRARAELVAHRCAGLDGVEVICGPLERLGDGRSGVYDVGDGADGARPVGLGDGRSGVYDVVLVVGVLEYAGTDHGGGGGPGAFLDLVVDALAPGGVMVLAIENRLGLKYLLGFPEDHLGLPWVGLEGYRPGEPTTWSRRELATMLADAGLTAQKWLYPFPDYKLPRAVLAQEIYDRPDAIDMVDQIVGHPTSSEYFQPVLVADDRAAHRTLLAAGLGPEVANSFLVVAGRDPEALAGRVEEGALAWRVAPDRRRRWGQLAVVVDSGSGRVGRVGSRPIDSDRVVVDSESRPVDSGSGLAMRRRLMDTDRADDFEGWLGQVVVAEEPYHSGRNLEQCLLECARQGDVNGFTEYLGSWRAELAARECPVDAGAVPHPFLPAGSVRALPPEWLDAGPDNFVVTADGLGFVDREWRASGGVDVRLVVVRGLWKVLSALLSARCPLPWPATWSNDRLIAHLGGLIGEEVDADLLERWRRAEDDLILRVYLRPSIRLAELHDAGSRSRIEHLGSPLAPYRRLEHLVHRQQELIVDLTGQQETAADLAEARTRLARVEAELAEARTRLARLAWRERLHNRIVALIRRDR